MLLAGNNGVLLQPFSLNNSTITKLQKLECKNKNLVVFFNYCKLGAVASLGGDLGPTVDAFWLK